MADFFLAFIFGGAQILLTRAAIHYINEDAKIYAIVVAAIKFAGYAAGLGVLNKYFGAHLFRCMVGFIAGMPVTALLAGILWAVLKDRVKKSMRKKRKIRAR